MRGQSELDSGGCLDEDAIVRLAAGAASGDTDARAHLDACPDCRALALHVARSNHETRGGSLARAMLEDAMDELPTGVVADRYELSEFLGAGGMGFVIAARDRQSGERVAIKFMRREIARSPLAVARFAREASAMAALKSPHAVRVLATGTHDGLPYLVMEYVQGISLAALVGTRGRLPWPEAVRHVMSVCSVLAEAHELGIIHRDIKPQNLLLEERAEGPIVRVLDFGLAKSLGDADGLTETSRLLGTPHYMAPEQIRDARGAERATDIWALGATLYRLVTGRHAFAGANTGVVCAEVLHGTPVPPTTWCPDCPRALERIILRCLERDPSRRFASAMALREALARALSGDVDGPTTMDAAFVPPGASGARRARLALLTVLVVAAVAGAGAVFVRARRAPATAAEAPRESATSSATAAIAAAPAPSIASTTVAGEEPTSANVTPTAPVASARSEPPPAKRRGVKINPPPTSPGKAPSKPLYDRF